MQILFLFTENCNLVPDEQLALAKSKGVDVDGSGSTKDGSGGLKNSANKIQQLTSVIIILMVALVI